MISNSGNYNDWMHPHNERNEQRNLTFHANSEMKMSV